MLSQTAVCSLYDVANDLSMVAGQIALLARRQCLTVFNKAKVVASHPLIERVLSARLHAAHIPTWSKQLRNTLESNSPSARVGAPASLWLDSSLQASA